MTRQITAIIAGALLFAGAANAAQYRIAGEDMQIAATISAREITRIAIRDDRIASMVARPDGFTVEHDGSTGDIFLVPTPGPTLGTKPVSIFVTSEEGRTYQLLLTPLDIPAEQIIIVNPRDRNTTDEQSPRREQLGRLMAAMISGRFLDDYTREAPVIGDLDHLPVPGADIDITEAWQGERFRGLSIVIRDPASELAAETLAPEAAASWLSDDIRPDGGHSAIIIVEARHGHD